MSLYLFWQLLALLGGVAFAFVSREVVFRLTRKYVRAMWALIAAYSSWLVIFAVGLAILPWLNGLIFPNPTSSVESNGVYLLTRLPWSVPLLIGAPLVMICDIGFWLARRAGIVKESSRSLAGPESAIRD